MVNCDDYGRYDGRLKVLKADLFPLKDGVTLTQIDKALNKLSTAGMVQVYEYDQKPFLQLVTWEKHQNIRNHKSKYPQPPANIDNCNQLQTIANNCNQSQTNAPVIQSESNPKSNPNTNSFSPPTLEEITEYCQKRKNNVEPKKFFDYFNETNWVDSTGKKVKSWKQKIITWEGNRNASNGNQPISNSSFDLDSLDKQIMEGYGKGVI